MRSDGEDSASTDEGVVSSNGVDDGDGSGGGGR